MIVRYREYAEPPSRVEPSNAQTFLSVPRSALFAMPNITLATIVPLGQYLFTGSGIVDPSRAGAATAVDAAASAHAATAAAAANTDLIFYLFELDGLGESDPHAPSRSVKTRKVARLFS